MTSQTDSSGAPPTAACGYPLQLEPIFQERVWGSEDLAFLYPSRPARPQRVGEVWLTGNENRVANGAWAGKTLAELSRLCGPALLGNPNRDRERADSAFPRHPSGAPVFPLLVKFLFTEEKLSVQLHPPDSVASARDPARRDWGKTEMWHVLRAAPGAQLAIGFRDDAREKLRHDRALLRAAIESGAMEAMLNWMEVKAGDTFFVPAGTVHAIGPGLVICEIQQNSDITYRLYDYHRLGTDGRPRTLHVEQGLEVLQWRTEGGRTDPVELAAEPATRLCLAACPHFATERWEFHTPFAHHSPGRLEIWIGLEGAAEFDAGPPQTTPHSPLPTPYSPAVGRMGEVVVIPADVSSLEIRPASPSVFLRTFVPDLEKDILGPLRKRTVSEKQLRRVCFPMSSIR